jgi:hypothetical protein
MDAISPNQCLAVMMPESRVPAAEPVEIISQLL